MTLEQKQNTLVIPIGTEALKAIGEIAGQEDFLLTSEEIERRIENLKLILMVTDPSRENVNDKLIKA